MASGITIAHYAAQVIVWVILLDSTTWTISDIITSTVGNTTITRSMASFDGQEVICNGKTQNYYRLVIDFPHVNSTGTALLVSIINNSSGGSCKWGLK